MNNIEYLGNDIYRFYGFLVSKDEYGYDLSLSEKATSTDQIYYNTFRMIILNDCTAEPGAYAEFSIPAIIDNYLTRESPKNDFGKLLSDYGFPKENISRKPYVYLEGVFSDNKAKWKVLYPTAVTELGIIDGLLLQRKGLVLYYPNTDEIYGSPNIYEYLVHKEVEEINTKWSTAQQQDKYKYLEELQDCVKNAGIGMDSHYAKINVVTPEKILPDIVQTSNGFKITSGVTLEDINQEEFNEHVENRIQTDNIYTVKNSKNEDVKILITPEQKQVLSDIKKMESASTDEIKEFLANPPENWNDEIVDVSNLYSDRVIGWQLYMPDFNMNNLPGENNWFENADDSYDEGNIDLSSDEHEKHLQRTLVIKDNEEDLDYEKKNQEILKTFKFPDIPGGYKGTYSPKDYQKEGIAWLYSLYINKNPGCILADDMGLEKTFQVLSFLQAASKDNLNVLIVTPAALLKNWEDEYYKFFNDIRYRIHTSQLGKTHIERLLQSQINSEANNSSNLFIASYESIRSCDTYIKIQWDIVILDEAQKIKNRQTLTNKTARALKSYFNVAVTGTPVENTFSDIWAISDFACPGYLGTHKEFLQNFSLSVDESDDMLIEKGKEIRKKLGMLLLRRLKDDNLPELPEKRYIREEHYMPDFQENIYKQVLALSAGKATPNEKLRVLQKLKQVSDHYSFIKKFDTQDYSAGDTAKTILLIEILKEIKLNNEKVIVFAEYIHTQDILASIIFKEFGIKPQIYNGSTNIYARESMLKRFKSSSGFDVIIMSPIAAGVGLTIIEANHVIHFSRHWNPAKEDQATDRVYRIGQTKTVFVYNLIGKIPNMMSFDEKLDNLLNMKQSVKGGCFIPFC